MPDAPLAVMAGELDEAADVEEITARLLSRLADVPGVLRVGFALSEGGGRRLRYTASDRVDRGDGGRLDWCHIDAYDDVPLTTVVRTGAPLLGDRDLLDQRYPDFGPRQEASVRGLAALPLPGVGGPIGGFLLMLDRPWGQLDSWWRRLESTARLGADAIRRARVTATPEVDVDRPGSGERLLLTDDPRSVRAARRFLRRVLDPHPVAEDLVDTAELCLSELVTNAVVHAGGEYAVTIEVADGVLTCSVRDHGAAGGPEDPADDGSADPMRVHGRGLQLVDVLADRWGSERDAGGSTTWFALAVTPAAE